MMRPACAWPALHVAPDAAIPGHDTGQHKCKRQQPVQKIILPPRLECLFLHRPEVLGVQFGLTEDPCRSTGMDCLIGAELFRHWQRAGVRRRLLDDERELVSKVRCWYWRRGVDLLGRSGLRVVVTFRRIVHGMLP
jgi:hypothetical protein